MDTSPAKMASLARERKMRRTGRRGRAPEFVLDFGAGEAALTRPSGFATIPR